MLHSLFANKKSSFADSIKQQSSRGKSTPNRPSSKQSTMPTPNESPQKIEARKANLAELAKLTIKKNAYDYTRTMIPPSRDTEVEAKGIRKSYRFAKDSTIGGQIKGRIKEEMVDDLRRTKHNLSLIPKTKGMKLPTESELKNMSFKNSALKVDKDPRVTEHLGPKEEKYIYNIGYTQTTNPVLTATAPAEYITKTGYYGKQGIYSLPTGVYQDHPVFHDMKKNNLRFSYQNGLTDTRIADDIVTEDKERWGETRDMRTLSRNFTSLSKQELERIAMRKSMKPSNSIANLNPYIDLMPNEIDPSDPVMRATAYNPYGKLLGKPYLKTPRRVDQEIYTSIESRGGNGTRMRVLNTISSPSPNSEIPRTFHELQTRRAMYEGKEGQKFTYAALN
jgi:hypothetical protein